MPIDKTVIIAPGMTLTGSYKGKSYTAQVLEHDGKVVFFIEGDPNGKVAGIPLNGGWAYKSLSGATNAVTDGKGPSGFWSIREDRAGASAEAVPPVKPQAKKRNRPAAQKSPASDGVVAAPALPRLYRPIVRMKSAKQAGAPEGQVYWWCNACADRFLIPAGENPVECPKGHSAEPRPIVL